MCTLSACLPMIRVTKLDLRTTFLPNKTYSGDICKLSFRHYDFFSVILQQFGNYKDHSINIYFYEVFFFFSVNKNTALFGIGA